MKRPSRCNSTLVCFGLQAQNQAAPGFGVSLPGTQLPSNAAESGNVVRVPGGRQWLELDETVGIENVMFLVSEKRRTDVEELLRYFNERAYAKETEDMFVPALDSPAGVNKNQSGQWLLDTGHSNARTGRDDARSTGWCGRWDSNPHGPVKSTRPST